MIPGLELWPDQDETQPVAQADIDALVEATRDVGEVLLKARFHGPGQLAQVAEAVPGAWFISRPRSEGWTATEIAIGIAQARRGFTDAGLRKRWLAHIVSGEPNHPDGPFRDTGAADYAAVLADGRNQADLDGVPLASPGLTPMYGTAAYAERLGRFIWVYRSAHCYGERVAADDGEESSLRRALDDVAVQVGADTPPDRVLVTELGDATRDKPHDARVAWVTSAMGRLAERRVAGATIFILRAPGWERYELGAAAFNQILRSVPAATMPTNMPAVIPPESGDSMPIVNGFSVGPGVAAALRELGDVPTSDEIWENPRTFSQTFAKRHVIWYNPASGETVVVERKR